MSVWEEDRLSSDLHVNADGHDACGGIFAPTSGNITVALKVPPLEGQSGLVKAASGTHVTCKNSN